MEEIAVSAAGGDVEINSPGAAIALTIKSGGHTFQSLNNVVFERASFVSDNLDSETAARGFTVPGRRYLGCRRRRELPGAKRLRFYAGDFRQLA